MTTLNLRPLAERLKPCNVVPEEDNSRVLYLRRSQDDPRGRPGEKVSRAFPEGKRRTEEIMPALGENHIFATESRGQIRTLVEVLR